MPVENRKTSETPKVNLGSSGLDVRKTYKIYNSREKAQRHVSPAKMPK